jgi:succinate dehydrogenase / fumarate reductase cytochrome b subunit
MYSHPGNRPRFLKLSAIHFPVNALLSGAHRLTGLALVISLVGYVTLANLMLIHPDVSLNSLSGHWLLRSLHTAFWMALSFHWLTGLRHLLAEHFIAPKPYEIINSGWVSALLIAQWILISIFISYQAWS